MRLREIITGFAVGFCLAFGGASPVSAAVGDPQIKTDHPWYPGELSCSTFERLFATQAQVYRRVTGRAVSTDEDKALASWYWRNLHYAHGEEGGNDCFGRGFDRAEWNREYWTGLFSHGFGLCGTTHAQYGAEINALLGHGRGRVVGVTGHNSFEVFLTGGPYANGRWALLDHDVSTVVFDESGTRLLSIAEIVPKLAMLKDPAFKPDRQRGWRVAGLHDDDAATYDSFRSVEYFAGYAGPPPMVHLRRGETLDRFFEPGLEDGKTFVFWGRNYHTAGVPGPERSRSWVNQPEKMFGSTGGAGHRDGQVRFANAVYTYVPGFADGSYKEGVIDEGPAHMTFEFRSPYVIGCTPPGDGPWDVYEKGGRNGLIVRGAPSIEASVSTDHGASWKDLGPLGGAGGIDATDLVKGRRHYWLRFDAGAAALKNAAISWRTVCQANVATMPRLRDGNNRITYLAGGTAMTSAGPDRALLGRHVVSGAIDSPAVTIELSPPRGEKTVRLYAAAWQASGAPPDPDVSYFIDYSTDRGETWRPVVENWKILRRQPEPADFWSQSFCWGDVEISRITGPVRVRYRNTGGKAYRTVEAHLVYEVAESSPAEVMFQWKDAAGRLHSAEHIYRPQDRREDTGWTFDAGEGVRNFRVAYRSR